MLNIYNVKLGYFSIISLHTNTCNLSPKDSFIKCFDNFHLCLFLR